jgi:phosphotransferase system  glucose/maltose/N-acetylglucosamine-specific IIC component
MAAGPGLAPAAVLPDCGGALQCSGCCGGQSVRCRLFAVAAVVFAALHLANPGATALAGATVAVAGLMFCALYALTGRLWVPIGLHLAWNFTQGTSSGRQSPAAQSAGSIAVSTARRGAQTWLTGGTFGPEASVFALILISVLTLGALSTTRKASQKDAGLRLSSAGSHPVDCAGSS